MDSSRADKPPSLAPPVASSSTPRSTDRQARKNKPLPERSGSARVRLPDLPGLQWEWNRRGGVECWHTPTASAHRRDRLYIGYFGLRQIRAAGDDLDQVIATWAGGRLQAKLAEPAK